MRPAWATSKLSLKTKQTPQYHKTPVRDEAQDDVERSKESRGPRKNLLTDSKTKGFSTRVRHLTENRTVFFNKWTTDNWTLHRNVSLPHTTNKN